MSEPKVLVLTVQPTYANCTVNGKKYFERFTTPLTKEQARNPQTKEDIKKRIIERLTKKTEPVTMPPVQVDVTEQDKGQRKK